MIKAISDFNDINKIWKSTIETQCEIDKEQVRSLTSSRGQMLDKRIDEYIFQTLSRTDVVALFEAKIDSENTIMTQDFENDNLLTYVYGKLKVIFYGQSSNLIATKFKARVESSEIRSLLWNEGINFDKITSIESIEEFINNTIYFRTDVNLAYSFRYDVNKITTYDDFTENQKPISGVMTNKETPEIQYNSEKIEIEEELKTYNLSISSNYQTTQAQSTAASYVALKINEPPTSNEDYTALGSVYGSPATGLGDYTDVAKIYLWRYSGTGEIGYNSYQLTGSTKLTTISNNDYTNPIEIVLTNDTNITLVNNTWWSFER